MEEEQTPEVPDLQAGGEAEPTGDMSEVSTVDLTDSTAQPAASQQVEQFDWSQFKNADRLAGRTPQEVIDYLNDLDYRYGRQSNELGELRSYKERYEALQRQLSGYPQQQEAPKKLTDAEKMLFAHQFQEDPYAAMVEHLGPRLAEQLSQQVLQNVAQQIGPAIQNQAHEVAIQGEWDALIRNHPEIQTDRQMYDMTIRLMQPDYLNYGVPFEQAYKLAKLTRDESSLFNDTCMFMTRGFPFETAKEYAMLKRDSGKNAETKKKQIEDEVKGLRGGRAATKKGRTGEPELHSMDDVLESMRT